MNKANTEVKDKYNATMNKADTEVKADENKQDAKNERGKYRGKKK